MPTLHKIYIILGLHVNFYHSWRGDTPDEAGFGTDMRVIRRVLKILDDANARGLAARVYWDWDVYWTLQEILPRHAPDILAGVRRRVAAGLDEIVLGPYNNGANHAATADELRAALAWAVENPFGSGLRQLFGRTAALYRPQEFMYSAGHNAMLIEQGIQGVILGYSGIPFNSLSTFVPALGPAERYNPLWLRCQPGEPRLALLPCMAIPDLLEYGSLEKLLLDLRRRQESGELDCDLGVHVNFDADNDAWLPLPLPRWLRGFPNTGGLEEYIRVVNKYPWAEFGLPSEYLAAHPPKVELLVRQDLADGGYDGSYSWAEKYTSLLNWTVLERSRLAAYRAAALLKGPLPAGRAEAMGRRLWQGVDSAFFQRLVGLSTTHFGMSTPAINEERQAKAAAILGGALGTALAVEREAACALPPEAALLPVEPVVALYGFECYLPDLPQGGGGHGARPLVRLPLILPAGVQAVRLEGEGGQPLPASLLNVESYSSGQRRAELLFQPDLAPGVRRTFWLYPADPVQPAARPLEKLRNQAIEIKFSRENGIDSLRLHGVEWAGKGFLEPFISYRLGKTAHSWYAGPYTLEALPGEQWDGLTRARLRTQIGLHTEDGAFPSRFSYTFTLLDEAPYLLVDVEAEYARTPARDVIHTLQQKLRRRIDLGWVEVAPFQLKLLAARSKGPLRIWKHNALGVTSVYELDYARINPRNRSLASFNHQATAGWVAATSGRQGLLLAESAESLASMAFCPMRLRQDPDTPAGAAPQQLWLNPFGSYYGPHLDYSHLGGSGIGAELTRAISGALRPNGPSFNGQTLRFSLLLAPYEGDRPPQPVQDAAESYFYPPGIIFRQVPAGINAVLPEDMVAQMIEMARAEAVSTWKEPLALPLNLLANPSDGAVDLAWDEPGDVRITGYEAAWQANGAADWQARVFPAANRARIDGLANGQTCRLRLRSLSTKGVSEWTAPVQAAPGAVIGTSLLNILPQVPFSLLLRILVEDIKISIFK